MAERDKETIFNELLCLRCRRGDQQSWRDLLARWERPLFYYIRRLVPGEQDAWDVLQKTWLAALRGISSLNEPSRLPVWLHRIARNLAMTQYRGSRESEPLPEDLPGGDMDDSPDAQIEMLDDAQKVHRVMARLSVHHREVLALHFLRNLPVEQIAQVLDVSAGTVKSRLHCARRALREILAREEAS